MPYLEIFISFAHEDDLLRRELEKQLSILKRQGLIAIWHDRIINAGAEWEFEIDKHLNSAQIILLLISPDFMDSEYCYSIEMKRAMERHEKGDALVIPIILRPVYWQGAPFGKLHPLPSEAKPVTSSQWHTQDEAFFNIAEGIRKAIERLTTKPPDTLTEIQGRPSGSQIEEDKQADKDINQASHYINWGDAPDLQYFYGREEELTTLKRWILNERCRLVAMLGMGGIGKTSLAAILADEVKQAFEYIFWYSLKNAPSLNTYLEKCILFLSNQKHINLPKNAEDKVSILIEYLREHRSLLILDNIESILLTKNFVGQYRDEYEGYGKLIQSIGEMRHQSCLIITSREKPKEVALLEGDISSVKSYQLRGLNSTDGLRILKDKGLNVVKKLGEDLVNLYTGNPLALKLVAQFIREAYNGNIGVFLKVGTLIFSDICDVLDQQFGRLSDVEQEILYWLAIERETVPLDNIQKNTTRPVSERELREAIRTLQRRTLLETNDVGFTLQNVVMEFVTDQLVERVHNEIKSSAVALFERYPLIMAQSKDYVRESQIHLILIPVIQRLLTTSKKEDIEMKFKSMLSKLREGPARHPSYAGGNILNLLIHLGCDLRGYDFSYLNVWQAWLQGIALPEVDFTQADLSNSVFTNTFGSVLSVAFSDTGDLLAGGTTNSEVRVWHAASGTPLYTYQGHTDWVNSVAFSPDGKSIASCSDDQTVRLWNISTGQCLYTLQGHTDWVNSVAFSPDGGFIASGSHDQTVRIWDVGTGQCLKILQGHTDLVRFVAFSPDGIFIASSSDDHTVQLWETSTGQHIKTLQGHTDWVYSATFNHSGDIIASGSRDQSVRIWDVGTGQCLKILQGHTDRVWSVDFRSDGNTLVSCSDDRTLRLWDGSTGQCLKTLQGHSKRINSVAFSPDGTTIVSGGDDQSIRLWDVSSAQCIKILQGYFNRVWSVACNRVGTAIVSGGDDRQVRLWNISIGHCFKTLQGHTDWIYSVDFSPDAAMVVSSGNDQTVRLWDVSSGQCLKILQGHTSWVSSVVFSSDGTAVASCGNDRTIRLWDVSSGQCLKILQGHTDRVWSIAINRDGGAIVSGGNDQTVRLWDVSSGQCLKILQGHTDRVRSVAFSPDGSIVASGSHDQTIRLWDVNTGQCLKTLQGHTDRVWSVIFSLDGTTIASGGNDRMVRLWNVSTGQCLQTLSGHNSWVYSVAFSPDGVTLVSCGDDGAIKYWDVQSGACVLTAYGDRPYESMNITGTSGLTEEQKNVLKTLGAIEMDTK